MPGELVRRAGALVRGANKDVGFAAGAQSTVRVSFSGQMITWRELPLRTRRAAHRLSRVVAEAVQPGDVRIEGGGKMQYATAWRAYEDAVVLAEVARPVRLGADVDEFEPGPWRHVGVHMWKVAGPPRRQRGVVDVADEFRSGARTGGGLRTIAPAGHGRAAEAWSYLPKAVRAAGERIVPTPDVWLGQLTQKSTANRFPLRQDICTLRMSAERAVVIVASRELAPIRGATVAYHEQQMARLPWVVEQVGLELAGAPDSKQLRHRPDAAPPGSAPPEGAGRA